MIAWTRVETIGRCLPLESGKFCTLFHIFDGAAEAKLIALACSKPPEGRVRWTLELLEEAVVERKIVDRASDNTIGRTLKKTNLSLTSKSNGSSLRMPTRTS
jgi:hypothetical protein